MTRPLKGEFTPENYKKTIFRAMSRTCTNIIGEVFCPCTHCCPCEALEQKRPKNTSLNERRYSSHTVPIFWSGSDATVAATPILLQKIGFFQKIIKIMISHHQSIDNNFLSFHKQLQPDKQKIAELWSKKYAHIWNNCYLRAILTYNLAKYLVYLIRTIELHIFCNFLFNTM